MLKHKYTDRICIIIAAAACIIAALFLSGDKLGITPVSSVPEYSVRIFDDSYVHHIDIQIDDWDKFLEEAPEEEYTECDVEIDGELFTSIGLRAKGNNSRRLVEEYGLDRYSLKIEFDHFQEGNTYYGLDKMSLDSSFQDNSYLKNYMTYDMMSFMGVPSPLCSYVRVTVNGEDWGLFLAVEEPEEAFARRNFGADYGMLYKPDYRSLEDANNDVALKYTTDNPEEYDNIFRHAKFDCTESDQQRLIQALKVLSEGQGTELESAVNVDEVLRYFTVQVFVVNLDSYLGKTGHNYFLYEEDGVISILPWDYNLAFATYSLGMPDPVNDAGLYVNYPIDTPAAGEIMTNRPLYHNLMKTEEYFARYHEYFNYFMEKYFENGYFEKKVAETTRMIAPYVEKDPTAFCSYEDYLIGVETFTKFCLLRSESVRGQLEGTIPSTIAGQEADTENRIDASEVWLPDMGEIADLRQ
ncbi:spore coat protein CotH [Mediterraneibacter catenae]|uniref:Spore coat protein CotH n=1 Tax=Mediterraneibacter catenae TaxID=2594882 RepID=A0A5M9I258_9FIRM|nr:CotH kinase family protein [Mediterraneibacter catenae]KAA8501365.1 spore coat protein CotH [Mediterraneibacter catenae]